MVGRIFSDEKAEQVIYKGDKLHPRHKGNFRIFDWSRLIRKVYEVDPRVGSRCGGTMKVVAIITRPDVIHRILSHLKLGSSEKASRASPSPAPSSGSTMEPQYGPLHDDLPWKEAHVRARAASRR